MQLSNHFTLEEFTRSDEAKKLGNDNSPTPDHLNNLRHLAMRLEDVRHILGDEPITITSAYRNPVVNKAVGGVPDSDHATGNAADITHPKLTPLQVAHKLAAEFKQFDQLILETSRNIVHISVAPRLRGQILTQPKGPGTAVTTGLPPL